jgi:hypothetical protein
MNQIITKAVASIQPADDDSESPTGAFDVILSAQTKDRDGETLSRDEWQEPFPEHITFDTDHGLSVASTVGSGKPFINDDGDLQVRGTYASIDRAQEVRALVNEGHIRTTSVAFLTHKNKKSATGIERELLNGSFVAIPANPDAIVLSSKALNVDKKDQETLIVTKGLSGSFEDLKERLDDELCERYPDSYPWIRATFLTDTTSGTVVYELRGDTYSRTFTDDGTTATLGDEVTDVSIITSVVPEKGESTEKSATDADTKSADDAKAAAELAAAETKSADEVELRARALQITLQSQSYAL